MIAQWLEHFLLLQSSIPGTLIDSLQLPRTPALGDLMLFSGLWGYLHTHTLKKKS